MAHQDYHPQNNDPTCPDCKINNLTALLNTRLSDLSVQNTALQTLSRFICSLPITKETNEANTALHNLLLCVSIAEYAKAFVHEPETWEMFQQLKGSESHSVPVEFFNMAGCVEEAFGAPEYYKESDE